MRVLTDRNSRAWWRRIVALLGLCLVCGVPLAGAGGSAGPGGGPAGGGDTPPDETDDPPLDNGGFSDDETVGTLPIVLPGGPESEGLSVFDGATIQLSIRGRAEHLWMSLIDAWGDGYVVQRHHDDGEIEWTFFGDVTILLNQASAQAGVFRTEMDYGMAFRGAPAAIVAGGWQSSLFALPAGGFDLPLDRMDHAGLLAGGGVHVHARAHTGERSVMSLDAWGGMLRIRQAR